MKRYIYNIQYNETDNRKLWDKVWIDANTKAESLKKLGKQFPGVYAKHLVKIENNYPFI